MYGSFHINLLSSKVQRSFTPISCCIDVRVGVVYQEFHHLKPAVPKVTQRDMHG